jgi:hypothetical protein
LLGILAIAGVSLHSSAQIVSTADLPIAKPTTKPSPTTAPTTKPAEVEPPHSELIGTTLHLYPSDARVEIPAPWADQMRRQSRNLYLRRSELAKIRDVNTEWDKEYCELLNALFPFELCEAHVGSEGFGPAGVLYIDLQMRAYMAQGNANSVEESMSTYGVSEAMKLGKKVACETTAFEGWRRTKLTYTLISGDYSGEANIEVFARNYGQKLAILAFMYGTNERSEGALAPEIVRSFSWHE